MKAILHVLSLCTIFLCSNYVTLNATETEAFNATPVAIFSMAPSSGDYPLTVSFNGSASYDPDGFFINHFWTFGDGTTGFGATTTHTYSTAGTFTASLLVTDLYGAAHSISKTVTVTAPQGIYTIAISPIEDAFLQVGTRQNISSVEVSPTKEAYLMFDLSGVIGNVIDANLRLSYEGLTSVEGRVTVWEGNHNSWSETNLSESNKPFPVQVVGERDSIFDYAYYDWDISGVAEGNTYSYILLSDDDNFVFGSSEFFAEDGRPQLFLTVDNSTPPVVPPTVSITTPSNDAILSPGTDIVVQSTANDADGIVARVEFYRGNILLGTDNSVPYSHTITGALLGEEYNIKAIAVDNEGYTTSSEMVHLEIGSNIAPIAIITAPTNGSTYVTGDNVVIQASASDSDGYITKVEFYDGAIRLGEDNTFPYEYTLSNISVGVHDLIARAYDSGGSSTVSSTITINVNNACGATAVAGLDFDGVTGSGLVADNEGGTNGVLQGGAIKVASSTGGNVLLLSSSGDYVEVPHYADIGFTENVTLSGWINMNQIIGDAGIIVKGSTARAYGLRISSTGTLNFNVPGGGSWTSDTALDLHRWYHVAATYDGTNVRFYIDGVLDTNQPTAVINFPSNNEPLTIGADLVNTNKFFDGLIDETEVYCRALTGAEIVTLASATAPNILPSLNVSLPVNGGLYYTGDDILIQADADDLDGNIVKVEFYVNGVKVNEDLTSPYEYTYAAPPVGTYSIVSRAFDDMGSVVTKSGISIMVQTPSITLEAECATVGLNIGTRSIISASNGQYISYPGIGKTFLSPPSSTNDFVRFTFLTSVVGTYEIHTRLQASNSFNDSFWVRINNGNWILFDNLPKSLGFTWTKLYDSNNGNTTVVSYLNVGLNIIDFAAREDGTKLDKISLEVAGTALPTGAGPAATNCSNLRIADPNSASDVDVESRGEEVSQVMDLKVYPNPFSTELNVSFPLDMEVEQVQLIDAKGSILTVRELTGNETNIQFQGHKGASGMYFVRIITANATFTKRVMHLSN